MYVEAAGNFRNPQMDFGPLDGPTTAMTPREQFERSGTYSHMELPDGSQDQGSAFSEQPSTADSLSTDTAAQIDSNPLGPYSAAELRELFLTYIADMSGTTNTVGASSAGDSFGDAGTVSTPLQPQYSGPFDQVAHPDAAMLGHGNQHDSESFIDSNLMTGQYSQAAEQMGQLDGQTTCYDSSLVPGNVADANVPTGQFSQPVQQMAPPDAAMMGYRSPYVRGNFEDCAMGTGLRSQPAEQVVQPYRESVGYGNPTVPENGTIDPNLRTDRYSHPADQLAHLDAGIWGYGNHYFPENGTVGRKHDQAREDFSAERHAPISVSKPPAKKLGPRKRKAVSPSSGTETPISSSDASSSRAAPQASNRAGQRKGYPQALKMHRRVCKPEPGCEEKCELKKNFPEKWEEMSKRMCKNEDMPGGRTTKLWEHWSPDKLAMGASAGDGRGHVMPAAPELPQDQKICRTKMGD